MPLLIYLWEFLLDIGALLSEAMPWLAKIGPWLASLVPGLKKFALIVIGWFGANTAETVLRGTVAITIRASVMVCWGIFLAVVFTGINGLGIREVCMGNPFSGLPAGMMNLVVHAFPVKFAFALCQSYVIWKFTYAQAALVMARTMKWLFGS